MLNLATYQTFCLVLAGGLPSGPTPAEVGQDVAAGNRMARQAAPTSTHLLGFDAGRPLLASNRLHA
jgi:hypothetical protein